MSIFDPNGIVTYDQAITMTMRALGYTEAALNGTYPACFVSKAVSLGAMKNLHSGSGEANRADCAQLIFNVLQQHIGKVGNNNIWVAFGSGEAGIDAYDTMLVRLGAHMAEATVDCEGEMHYNGGDYAVVTMDMCEDEDTLIDLHSMLGHKISVYHNDECEIVAVAEVLTSEVTGKLKDGKIGDVKLVDADEEPECYFYNGYEMDEEDLPETVDLSKTSFTYTVEMKGSKIDNIVAVMIWEVTADEKVDKNDLPDITDEDAPSILGVPFKVVDEDADEMEIDTKSFVLEGVDSLEDIAENNVVYVYAGGYEDEAAHVTKIQVGTKVVSGVYDEIASNGKKVTVEDTTYSIWDQLGVENGIHATKKDADDKNYVNAWAKAGGEGSVYLDFFGKFYTLKDIEDPETGYVVVLKTQKVDNEDDTDTDTSIDNTVNKIKVFTADGEAKIYNVNVAKVGEDVWDEVKGDAKQIVKLTLDKNDKVTGITIIEMEESDGDINKKGIVVDKEYVLKDEKAVVFAFEDGDKLTKESNWSVVKASSLWNKEVEELSVNADSKGVVKVAVVSDATVKEGDVSYGIIKSYSEIKDYAKVAVLLDGEATTVKWDKEDEEFNHDEVLTKPGQVLYAIELDDNEIVSVDPFDADDNENFNEHHAVVTTTAASIDDLNRLWLEEEVTDESGAVKLVNKWYALDDEVVVYVYDKSDSAWTVKTASYLNGLKLTKTEAKDATKKIEINLYDTNDKDKEYYNVVIVVRP